MYPCLLCMSLSHQRCVCVTFQIQRLLDIVDEGVRSRRGLTDLIEMGIGFVREYFDNM